MSNVFDAYLETEPIIKNREVLRHSYAPTELPHRKREIEHLASILAPALRRDTPSNVFIYGKTGTGKTVVTRYVGRELLKKSEETKSNVVFVYVNCAIVDTEYGVLSHIGNTIIKDWDSRIPFTGWAIEKVYEKLCEEIDAVPRTAVVALDEIDKLVTKSGDDVLYKLSRMNVDLHRSTMSLVGISNTLKFTEFLDARVMSSLGQEEMIFPPYDATQLQDILSYRAALAFREGALGEGVITLCGALAAQEHGDARKALDLLRVAAEIAERSNAARIEERHVLQALNKLELDRVTEVIRTLPAQSKIILFGIVLNAEYGIHVLTTGEVYDTYRALTTKAGIKPLTQRRVTDLISELDMLGILNARVVSKGTYGRSKEIQLSVHPKMTRKTLLEDELLHGLASCKPPQQRLSDF